MTEDNRKQQNKLKNYWSLDPNPYMQTQCSLHLALYHRPTPTSAIASPYSIIKINVVNLICKTRHLPVMLSEICIQSSCELTSSIAFARNLSDFSPYNKRKFQHLRKKEKWKKKKDRVLMIHKYRLLTTFLIALYNFNLLAQSSKVNI